MAGKKKPPRPLGENARPKRPAGSTKKQRPATAGKDRPSPSPSPPRPHDDETTSPASTSDEHLRQRLEAALAAAALSDAAVPQATSTDLRARLQAALGPDDDDEGAPSPPAASVAPPAPPVEKQTAAAPQPVARRPVPTQPAATKPVATQPVATKPVATKPVATQPVATQPPASRSSRTRVVMLVAGLLLIGGIGVVLIRSVGQEPEGPPRLSTTSAQPAAPVPVRAGSSYVATEVLRDGTVRVSHWVRPRAQAYELTLSSPDVLGGGPLRATNVRVDVDGTSIPGPTSIAARPHTYVLPGGRQILVTYRLSGAVELSPSVEGRALVRVVSLDLSVGDVQTRIQAVEGVEILSMACTANRVSALPEPCGETVGGDRWEVRLTGSDLDDRVMAQVDLG